jgi:hypothetical protein
MIKKVSRKDVSRMITRHGLRGLVVSGLLAALILPCSPAGAAEIKCWKNDEGVRECGSVIPPEYAGHRIEVINERGVVVKVIEAAPTPEEIAERERKEQQKKEEEKRQAEQHRKDEILLRSYTTEQDIIIAKKNNLQAIQSIIDISEGSLNTLNSNLETLKKRAANYERAGKEPPKKLLHEIEQVNTQIEDKKAYIEKKKAEKKKMEQKFEAQLKRFHELKHGKDES